MAFDNKNNDLKHVREFENGSDASLISISIQ